MFTKPLALALFGQDALQARAQAIGEGHIDEAGLRISDRALRPHSASSSWATSSTSPAVERRHRRPITTAAT
jgi:hypothetical protein